MVNLQETGDCGGRLETGGCVVDWLETGGCMVDWLETGGCLA